MRRIVGWGVVLLLLLSVPVSVLSQVSTIVRGTVTDSTGGVIPGASVTVVHETTDEATTRLTDEIGNYEFTGLPPGIYTLTADMPGFEVGTYSNVELAAGQEVLRNFTLEISAAARSRDRSPSRPCRSTSSGPRTSPARAVPTWQISCGPSFPPSA